MAIRPEVPASVRYYFRARLRPFTRPAFWGSLSVLSLIGLFAWEAWQHPEWLFKNPDNATPITDSALSKEDSAVAADIDNSQVLMQELSEDDASTATLQLNQQSQKQSFLDEYLKQQAEQTAKIGDNALITQPAGTPVTVYDPLNITQTTSNYSSPLSTGNQAAPRTYSVDSNNVTGSTPQDRNVAPVNPLQAALDRYVGTNPLNTSVQNQTQINTPQATTNNLSQSIPINAAAAGQVAQSGSPYTGTTNYSNLPAQAAQPGSIYPSYSGYGVAPATSNPANAYTYSNPNVPVPVVPSAQQVVPQVAPVTQGYYGTPVYQNQVPVNAVPNNFGTTQIQPSQLQPSALSIPQRNRQ